MINNINISHKGEQIYNNNSFIIRTEEQGDVEVLTTFDLLEVLKTTKFGSNAYENYNEILLNYADDDTELSMALHNVCSDLYAKETNTYKPGNKGEPNHHSILKNVLGYGGRFFFFKKDIDTLKRLKQRQEVTSAYSGSTSYGIFIDVTNLEIYDQDKQISFIYNGEIQIFQDNNELGFGIYNIKNI